MAANPTSASSDAGTEMESRRPPPERQPQTVFTACSEGLLGWTELALEPQGSTLEDAAEP